MSKKCWLTIAVLFALAIALVIAIPMLLPPTPGVTYANYSRIENGMSRDAVKALLGEPVEEGGVWRSPAGNRVRIEFDVDGVVVESSWNGTPDERSSLEKLRDRMPWIAHDPPRDWTYRLYRWH